MKKALITGVTGQDGSYLAELLLEKGYDVTGMLRRTSADHRDNIRHLQGDPRFHLCFGDMNDSLSLTGLVGEVRPDEIYNLAAQSFVQASFKNPEYTAMTDGIGVLRLLEAVRCCGLEKSCRLFQASTSDMFGKTEECPQNEDTPFHPGNPYSTAKLFGYWTVRQYREAYGMFCCSGIMFNHESERRGEEFVTRKITKAAAGIALGKQKKLTIGNMDAKRDWGYAPDFALCMWQMLQADRAQEYVIATGVQHSVRELVMLAFHYAGIELSWEGSGLLEKGVNKDTGETVVEIDPRFYRPNDISLACGDASRIRNTLGCDPGRTGFEEMVRRMVVRDLELWRR